MPPHSEVMGAVGVDNTAEALGFATFDRYSVCSGAYLLGDAIDRDARQRHEAYLAKIEAAGRPLRNKPTQFPWDELDEMVKASNRRQVEHEPVKRRALEQLGNSAQTVELLARAEHRRWMADLLMADILRVRKLRAVLDPYPALTAYADRILARSAFLKAQQDQLDHFAAADAARAKS